MVLLLLYESHQHEQKRLDLLNYKREKRINTFKVSGEVFQNRVGTDIGCY